MGRLTYYGKRWKGRNNPPPFNCNDLITPSGKYRYGGNHKWPTGELRKVDAVQYDAERDFWTLKVWNPHLKSYSHYNPHNFVKETDVAYEKTKYFAMKLDSQYENGKGIALNLVDGTETILRDTASAVKRDVEDILQPEEQWIILQTHSLLEALPPRPPLRVTEYK